MPQIGDREVRTCKTTGKPVEMQYEGFDGNGKDLGGSAGANGNPGWLCLHDEDEEGPITAMIADLNALASIRDAKLAELHAIVRRQDAAIYKATQAFPEEH